MKKIYLFFILAAALAACEKREVDEPSLEIMLPKTTYAVNDTLNFTMEGDADLVTFYSGQQGSEFKYRERLEAQGTPQLSFTTNRNPAFPTGVDNTLKVLASTDFNGLLTTEAIQAATWTDLTSRGALSRLNSDQPFGSIDLTDVAASGKPVYFAFKTAAPKSATAQPTWVIKGVSVDLVTEVGPPQKKANIKNMTTLSFGTWSVLNPLYTWAAPTTAQLQSNGAAANQDDNEDWVISQAVNLKTVARDLGTSIKTTPKTKLNKFQFIYTAAGTYTAVFEVMNVNRFGNKSVLKEFVITIK